MSNGISKLYVPDEYATLGWALVFTFSINLVADWGTRDEAAVAEFHHRIESVS